MYLAAAQNIIRSCAYVLSVVRQEVARRGACRALVVTEATREMSFLVIRGAELSE